MKSTSSSRVGAHRPRRRTGPVVAVLLLLLVIAGVVVGVRTLTGLGRSTPASTSTGTPAAATSAVPSAVPSSGSPTPEPSESSGSASGSSSAEPTADVDRAAPVTVLNATGRAGLATGVAATLRSAGWSVTSTGNYRQTAPPTTVYYAGSRLRATARAISEDLPGTQRVVRSTQFGDAVVTVVIGADYSG